jgi:V8-like Glu-specific endopeptidase
LVALATVAALAGCGVKEVEATGAANLDNPPIVPVTAAEARTVDLVSEYELPPADPDSWDPRHFEGVGEPGGYDPSDIGQAPNDEATGLFALPTDGGAIGSNEGVGLGDSSRGDPMPTGGLKDSTTGRIYMMFLDALGDPQYYVCSGTVITSAAHDLIATAGHCVWDTSGLGFVAELYFVPGDVNDSETQPYGRWSAVNVFVPTEFTEDAFSTATGLAGEGWAYDYAFVRLAPNDAGQKIQDVTGGQGIAFGIPAETLVAIGYPAGEPFDGRSERYCASSDWRRYAMGGYQIDCVMTGGSSGGGWFTRWDPDRGAGYLVGVTSTGTDTTLNANALGRTAYELFDQAGGVAEGLFEGGGA